MSGEVDPGGQPTDAMGRVVAGTRRLAAATVDAPTASGLGAGGVLVALGGIGLAAWCLALLSSAGSGYGVFDVSQGLHDAEELGQWLTAAGWFVFTLAIVGGGWLALVRRQWLAAAAAGAVVVPVLVAAIAHLLAATGLSNGSLGGYLVPTEGVGTEQVALALMATGILVWAAIESIGESQTGGRLARSPVLLALTVGIIVLAVGIGITGLAGGIVTAIGALVLSGSVVAFVAVPGTRSLGPARLAVAAGLVAYALGALVAAVVLDVVDTVDGLLWSTAIGALLHAAAAALVALGAWQVVRAQGRVPLRSVFQPPTGAGPAPGAPADGGSPPAPSAGAAGWTPRGWSSPGPATGTPSSAQPPGTPGGSAPTPPPSGPLTGPSGDVPPSTPPPSPPPSTPPPSPPPSTPPPSPPS